MDYVLGVDIGTSACKATLVDAAGAATTASSDSYAFDALRADWAEQDPATWLSAAVESVARVLDRGRIGPDRIAALGLTGQMHSAVLLDTDLEVIRPPLLWCDQRPAVESARGEAGFPRIREITLNPLLPAFTLSKLLWSRAHEPEAYARIRHVILAKDLMRLWMTGSLATDPSDAAGTAMFDAINWRWSPEILDHFGISAAWLPDVIGSSEIAGRVTREAAAAFGLLEGTPVIAGGGDQAAQAVGLGAIDERILVAQVGTSGVIVAAVRSPVQGAFCHAIPDRWIRLDSLHAAGSSLPWIRDAVAPGEKISAVLDAAAKVEPGSTGLLFLPFLMGERAGFASSAPAAFVGLRPQHGRGDLVRAVLEGVAFELRRMRDEWFADGDGPAEVRIVGGGVRNALWQQVLADTFNVPMTRLDRDSAYGAAVLAGIGMGWWSSAPEPVGALRIEPDRVGARVSDRAYMRYRRLYDAMHQFAGQQEAER